MQEAWFVLSAGLASLLILKLGYESFQRQDFFGTGTPRGRLSKNNWQFYIIEFSLGIFTVIFFVLGCFSVADGETPPSKTISFNVGTPQARKPNFHATPSSGATPDIYPSEPNFYPDEMEENGPCDGWGDCYDTGEDDFEPYYNGQEWQNSPDDYWGDGR